MQDIPSSKKLLLSFTLREAVWTLTEKREWHISFSQITYSQTHLFDHCIFEGQFCDHPNVTNARVIHLSGGNEINPQDILHVGNKIMIDCHRLYFGDSHQVTLECGNDNRYLPCITPTVHSNSLHSCWYCSHYRAGQSPTVLYGVDPFLANYHSFTISGRCDHFQVDSVKYVQSNKNSTRLFIEVNRPCNQLP